MRQRIGVRIAALLLAGAAVPVATPAWAAAWPERPVHWVVPYTPGGATDIVARIVGAKLSIAFGQTVVIDNRPGAGGNVGTDVVAKSPPDGYTMLFAGVAHAISETAYAVLPFDLHRDLTSVILLSRLPNVMVVAPQFPARSVLEYIALAKAQPGKLNFASSGNGTSVHLSGELFKFMAGIDMAHVPYRGAAPAIQDLIGGHVQVMFDNIPSAIGHVRSGNLRALAVTTLTRSQALPDLPTIAETVPGYEAYSWFSIMVPAGTPTPVVQRINRDTNTVLALPEIRERLLELGATPAGGTPEACARFLDSEIEKWGKVVHAAHVTIE
jgi:tripartite-type tricarboxylate transporter receptor subunit TctC